MQDWPITIRYAVIGLAIGLINLVWRISQRGLTGETAYDLPYILTMLFIPALIGYAIGFFRKSRGAT